MINSSQGHRFINFSTKLLVTQALVGVSRVNKPPLRREEKRIGQIWPTHPLSHDSRCAKEEDSSQADPGPCQSFLDRKKFSAGLNVALAALLCPSLLSAAQPHPLLCRD